MASHREEEKSITLLGNQNTKYADDYAPEVLETFINKHPDNDYFVKFNCPEFTSLCPITGHPLGQHGVGHLQEADDIGAGLDVALLAVLSCGVGALAVDVLHDLLQLGVHRPSLRIGKAAR